MVFVKLVKNKAYFKRYQVKWRRRREGKTDYYARKRLVVQDKNKYSSPKYRLVVRFTNTDVVIQVVYATTVGDKVLSYAYAHELPRYGITVGLTNYAAAYCVGLLAARRTLSKLGLAEAYEGNTKIDGNDYIVESEGEKNPFYCLLDVGLARTTTGTRVFAAMKGACDGGMEVPHNEKRFVGYDSETKTLDAAVLRKYLFGGHVADYMRHLQEEDAAKYQKQFSRFVKAGVKADDLEALYTKAHAAIRKDPSAKQTTKKATVKKHYAPQKLTLEQRKAGVAKRKAAMAAAAQ